MTARQKELRVVVLIPSVEGFPDLSSYQHGTIEGLEALPDVTVFSVPGEPTRDRITRYLRSSQPDVVIWIGHGKPGKLLISKEESITAEWLGHELQRFRVRLAMLMACHTAVQDEGHVLSNFMFEISRLGIDVVGAQGVISADVIRRYTVEFIREYTRSRHGPLAHRISLEALLAKYPQADIYPMFITGESVAGLQDIRKHVDELENALTNGNAKATTAVLVKLEEAITDVREQVRLSLMLYQEVSTTTGDLDKRVKKVEQWLFPSLKQRFYLGLSVVGFLTLCTLWYVQESRVALLAIPYMAILITITLVALVVLSGFHYKRLSDEQDYTG